MKSKQRESGFAAHFTLAQTVRRLLQPRSGQP